MAALVTRTIDFAETAPGRAEQTVVIDASTAEVWAAIIDNERWPEWFPNVKVCTSTSDPATGVGSTREVRLPGNAMVEERFIAWEDEALWAFTAETMKPTLFRSLVERVTLTEPTPGRTSVTYRMAFEPTTATRLVAPMVRFGLERNLAKALAGLADHVVRSSSER